MRSIIPFFTGLNVIGNGPKNSFTVQILDQKNNHDEKVIKEINRLKKINV